MGVDIEDASYRCPEAFGRWLHHMVGQGLVRARAWKKLRSLRIW